MPIVSQSARPGIIGTSCRIALRSVTSVSTSAVRKCCKGIGLDHRLEMVPVARERVGTHVAASGGESAIGEPLPVVGAVPV